MLPVLLLEPPAGRLDPIAPLLRDAGVSPIVAPDADSALYLLGTQAFASILVAADLSDEDCLAALRAIRRKAPRTWILAITDDEPQDIQSTLHSAGVDGHLSRRDPPAELIRRIAALAVRRRRDY